MKYISIILFHLCVMMWLAEPSEAAALLTDTSNVAVEKEAGDGQLNEYGPKWDRLYGLIQNQDSLKWGAFDDFSMQLLEKYLPKCGAYDKAASLMELKDKIGKGARAEITKIMESLSGQVETLNGYYGSGLKISEKALFESVIRTYFETVNMWFVPAYVGDDDDAPARCDKIIGIANFSIAKAARISASRN